MKRFTTQLGAAALGLAVLGVIPACSRDEGSPVAPSPVVVHDALNAPGGASSTEFYEAMRSGGADRQFYDDFVSPTTVTIRTVAWQGGYSPARPAATSFFIAFIADAGNGHPRKEPDDANSGRPRSLSSATYLLSQVNESLDVTFPCVNSNQQCGLYNYSVTLASPFTASAGVRYWLTIQADVPFPAPASWGWRRGTPQNLRSSSNIAGATHLFDFAFALR
jgi:hypothetical protein